MTSKNLLAAKIWSFCDTLRDDGLGYNDYLEQLTYLLFLKMADENSSKYNLPPICDWRTLSENKGGDLQDQYETILKTLGTSGGMLENIFGGAQNKIHDSAKLKKLISLIGEETWTSTEIDVKGEIYESLLQKNAESSGAGQYFTPRPVIKAMVECVQPQPMETIADPSCGTGGFFLGVVDYLEHSHKLNKAQSDFLKFDTFHGWEIEKSTARLCLMNLYLHGIGDLKQTPDIHVTDSLKQTDVPKVNIVLANPPFGKSSSDVPTPDETLANKEGYYLRKDFWVTTSNKQLAFMQHIVSMLQNGGRAAVVLPDNVLFEGGAGETIRKQLLQELNLHTILRLPTGIFYAQGVKANVLFFDKPNKVQQPVTKEVWFYDYRTNVSHSPKKNPLRFENLQGFVDCYHAKDRSKSTELYHEQDNPKGRWKKCTYEEILSRDKTNLDITWLKDDSVIDLDNLPEPDELINDIIENVESALASFRAIRDSLG